MSRACLLLVLAPLLFVAALTQEPGTRVPSVELAPVAKVQVKAGGSATVQLDFRVGSEFHINSNKPKSELLIPTVLKLSPTPPVNVASVKYPDGQDMSFPFAPDEKLSVYSGDFTITAVMKAPANAPSGNVPVSGSLRFQACDRSACYPPRSIPVSFNVSIVGR
jgi:hypothetical protein